MLNLSHSSKLLTLEDIKQNSLILITLCLFLNPSIGHTIKFLEKEEDYESSIKNQQTQRVKFKKIEKISKNQQESYITFNFHFVGNPNKPEMTGESLTDSEKQNIAYTWKNKKVPTKETDLFELLAFPTEAMEDSIPNLHSIALLEQALSNNKPIDVRCSLNDITDNFKNLPDNFQNSIRFTYKMKLSHKLLPKIHQWTTQGIRLNSIAKITDFYEKNRSSFKFKRRSPMTNFRTFTNKIYDFEDIDTPTHILRKLSCKDVKRLMLDKWKPRLKPSPKLKEKKTLSEKIKSYAPLVKPYFKGHGLYRIKFDN